MKSGQYAGIGLAAALLLIVTTPVFGAGYMKFDGVDGEARDTQEAPARQGVSSGDTERKTGLLLPAVQKARSPSPQRSDSGAAPAAKGSKGNVEANWKVEKGE